MGKLRTALLATVGGLGTAAVANRTLAGAAGDLDPPLPGESKTYRWRGIDVAYTEAGDPEDPDVLLLHGINAAATSREYRAIWEKLADDYHLIAPDLPGFGRSERPPLVYSASLYQSFVGDVADDLTDEAVWIASGLTGAYAAAAAENGDPRRLVLITPTSSTMGEDGGNVALRTLLRSPLVGTALFNLIVSRPSLRYFADDHGYYDIGNKDPDLTDYQWQTGHQPGARYAPASFLSGHLDPDFDLAEVLGDLDVPVTLVWGRESDITPLSYGRELADQGNCRLVVVDYALLQPHAEHPEQFLDGIREDLQAAAEA